jgi:gas vesicle protein
MTERDREQPVVIIERSDGSLGGFLWGLLVGTGLALLFAPKTGEETRRALKDRGRRFREAAEEKAEELQTFVGGGYEKSKGWVEEGVETARRSIDEKREGARDAVDAGKAAVHSARDELGRRLTKARTTRTKGRKVKAKATDHDEE